LDTFSKNAVPWGQNQKQKVAVKCQSALLGPLPKSSTPKAWQGERQKLETKVAPEKKQTTVAEEKSKAKDKSKTKTTTAKQTVQGKKVNSNSTKKGGTISELSTDTAAHVNKVQPILTPPPGFGTPQMMNVPVSPSVNTQFPPRPATESKLSLETMLLSPALTGGSNDADLSLSDLLFTGVSIRDSNPSPTMPPTMHGFRVADVAMTSENASALPPPIVEEQWLPTILNNDAESGFDVMDFLDGILQDGSNSEDDVPAAEIIELSAPGTPSRIIVGGTGGNATTTTTATPVSANPWARESRAAAYGISFDDDDDEDGNIGNASTTMGLDGLLKGSSMDKGIPVGHLGGNIPLLTPAAILNAEENNNIAAVVEEDDKAISFYAGLLEE